MVNYFSLGQNVDTVSSDRTSASSVTINNESFFEDFTGYIELIDSIDTSPLITGWGNADNNTPQFIQRYGNKNQNWQYEFKFTSPRIQFFDENGNFLNDWYPISISDDSLIKWAKWDSVTNQGNPSPSWSSDADGTFPNQSSSPTDSFDIYTRISNVEITYKIKHNNNNVTISSFQTQGGLVAFNTLDNSNEPISIPTVSFTRETSPNYYESIYTNGNVDEFYIEPLQNVSDSNPPIEILFGILTANASISTNIPFESVSGGVLFEVNDTFITQDKFKNNIEFTINGLTKNYDYIISELLKPSGIPNKLVNIEYTIKDSNSGVKDEEYDFSIYDPKFGTFNINTDENNTINIDNVTQAVSPEQPLSASGGFIDASGKLDTSKIKIILDEVNGNIIYAAPDGRDTPSVPSWTYDALVNGSSILDNGGTCDLTNYGGSNINLTATRPGGNDIEGVNISQSFAVIVTDARLTGEITTLQQYKESLKFYYYKWLDGDSITTVTNGINQSDKFLELYKNTLNLSLNANTDLTSELAPFFVDILKLYNIDRKDTIDSWSDSGSDPRQFLCDVLRNIFVCMLNSKNGPGADAVAGYIVSTGNNNNIHNFTDEFANIVENSTNLTISAGINFSDYGKTGYGNFFWSPEDRNVNSEKLQMYFFITCVFPWSLQHYLKSKGEFNGYGPDLNGSIPFIRQDLKQYYRTKTIEINDDFITTAPYDTEVRSQEKTVKKNQAVWAQMEEDTTLIVNYTNMGEAEDKLVKVNVEKGNSYGDFTITCVHSNEQFLFPITYESFDSQKTIYMTMKFKNGEEDAFGFRCVCELGSVIIIGQAFFDQTGFIAPICFMKDTIVKTDQGDLKIQDINPNINTINREKIITISKTIHPDEYLVKLNKDDISQDVPDKLTIVSPQHKILYNNKLTRVMDLPMVEYPGKNMIKNNNDTLYNILTENYSTYIANNMVSETLDPENRTSIIYQCLQKASIKETNETLTKYNEFNMNIHKNRELNKLSNIC
jgi:hypothetical protein